MNRYLRTQRVTPAGPHFDRAFRELRVLLVGLGGTGTPIAQALVRGGVGQLTMLDPDSISEADLPRQILYYPEDVEQNLSKCAAAQRELSRIGGRTQIDAHSESLHPGNALHWIEAVDIVIDATDHLPVRGWINEACRTSGRPWIHTAAIEDLAIVLPFWSVGSPCFRCYLPEDPPLSAIGTCESRGVLPAATQLAAALAVSALYGWICEPDTTRRSDVRLTRARVGDSTSKVSTLSADPTCPVCGPSPSSLPGAGQFRAVCGQSRLEGWTERSPETLVSQLLGRNEGWEIRVERSIARARLGEETLVVFPDGRVIYGPLDDLRKSEARLQNLILG